MATASETKGVGGLRFCNPSMVGLRAGRSRWWSRGEGWPVSVVVQKPPEGLYQAPGGDFGWAVGVGGLAALCLRGAGLVGGGASWWC